MPSPMRMPGPPGFQCESCSLRQAAGDALTGLADRTGFRRRLADLLAGHEAPSRAASGLATCSAVLLIDLDRFKTVNDTMGHAMGDALLCAVARRIQGAIRKDDLAARLGGDEFAVLLNDVAGRADLAVTAARLVDLVARPYLLLGQVANIGASIGVTVIEPGDGKDGDAWIQQADMAMYQAKSQGRNRHCFFEPELQSRAEARRLLESDLRAALALGQFELFYQPQLQLDTRALVGFEALIRWRHPTRGLVPPDAFIPALEQLGLIAGVGEWVVRQACAEAAKWPGHLVVAVNVAAAQFDNGRLVPAVAAALERSALPGAQLELEITETVLLKNDSTVLNQLLALKKLGVQISLDDFGTGYSSLTQLRSFPFDRVKIDRSFADDPAVVRAVAALSASLGMRTTAEGVETAEQLERLASDGCTEVQGYLLSRPVPASHVAALIAGLVRTAPTSIIEHLECAA